MAEEKKSVDVRAGVIRYTKPPENKIPPSQRPPEKAKT
jgi:hypothetical protein